MNPESTTRRRVREVLELAFDPDICAVHEEDEMRAERAEIEQILAEVDRELAAEARTEAVRIDRKFADERRARRASRRAERATLRSLPRRLEVSEATDVAGLGGEAA